MNEPDPLVHQAETLQRPPGRPDQPSSLRRLSTHDSGPGAAEAPAELPPALGRYRVTARLGAGGFGVVYRAYDDELGRDVAIKVPTRLRRPGDVETYLREARVLASLDHPHIVGVYDVGRTEDGGCYVVSKLIEGQDLALVLQARRLPRAEAADLTATIAEALHFAHGKGLVHRDVKPANILIDRAGKVYLADFGLALRDEEFGGGPGLCGTPAYMSPEQASGEGHRVDGRSDIFSLGVVLYELLVGRLPFRGETSLDILIQVTTAEARPPRQIDDTIPRELERICLKALAQRASERYTTAKDLAEDLRDFLRGEGRGARDEGQAAGQPSIAPATASVPPGDSSLVPRPSSLAPLKIVPKGLRSFDANDADFFLELLPGPRDRQGLPDSLRFWKSRIEERDPDATFAVGLIYGPSGCGKSSLVKAGLLPRLSDAVIAVYLEATAGDTEQRLLHGLRKRCPSLPHGQGLKEALATLRRDQGAAGKKVLIVLDQFEQWLHARREEQNTELVQALRQCDGRRVQCIVMVRDDFWMAATRFMRDLEVRLVEGENSAAVDLFPLRHAEKVLAAFGRAFGVLPDNPGETSKEQKQFLEQAVAGLAQDGKVISVRLALFAEMMKGKAWTPASLKAVGGTEGVGVTFLEETFSAATAPPEHRYHQRAARADLKILLPETGSDIKGHMRSYAELLEASGYGGRPQDFDDLIRILDNEIRLITPTDPEGKDANSDSVLQTKPDQKYYQLTHDYLVHSIREWLTRKQKETRRGRAELLLADRAAVWNARPENRQLPSLVQWCTIRCWTQKKNWTPPQKKMMAKAGTYHALRGMALGLLLAVAMVAGLILRERVVEQRQATHAAGLVGRLLDADTAQVPGIVDEMAEYRKWTDPLLREEIHKAADKSRQKLHASLALLPVDGTQVAYLYDRLLDALPHEVPVLRDALAAHKDGLLENLWAVALKPESGGVGRPAPSARRLVLCARLRAAAVLATYDPESDRWAKCGPLVVNNLVRENPVYLGQWTEAFRPVKNALLLPLADIFRDRSPERAAERTLATNLLADYAADQPRVLADLLMDADDEQFAVIYAKLKDWGEQGSAVLTNEIDKQPTPVTMDWTVRFFRWEKVGESKPPADWEAVLKSPVLKELRTARLRLSGEEEPTPPPADNVPSTYFAVLATTEVILGESESILTTTYDDGIRVWLDDKPVLEEWGVNPPRTSSVTLTGSRGRHTLKIEFIQIEGGYILDVSLDVKEKLAKRQANAAVALLRMNQPTKVWPLLKHSPDPRVRSYLLHRLSPLGADAGAILKQLDVESDVTIRQALILSLGEYGGTDLPPDARNALLPKLQEVYRTASDPGLHAACEWLLRSWKQGAWLTQVNEAWAKDRELREKRLEGIGKALAKDQEKTPPQWYVNSQGQTMVVIPGPVEFLMGSPPTEAGRYGNEPQYKTRIGQPFVLSAKPVTVDEYRKFNPRYGIGEIALWARSDDCPVIGTNWFHAVAYCNWLSKQEGLPESEWCYEPFLDPKTWPLFAVRTVGLLSSPGGQGALLASAEMYPGRTDARYEGGMRLAPNYLQRQGYRLPTEAEMEYATRAGALTARYYGETDELLPKYAWYKQNAKDRTWPVGILKPNDLGFFDVQGNVSVWCQDRYRDDPTDKEEIAAGEPEGGSVVSGTVARVGRGGSFDDREAVARSAFRIKGAPASRSPGIGFRPARTFRPGSSPTGPPPTLHPER